jgi:hypothetical protein
VSSKKKEERMKLKKWRSIAIAALLVMSMAVPAAMLVDLGVPAPAFANEELHPGSRLFFPYWDVTGNRITFIIITRLALFPTDQGASNYSTANNCKPGHTTAFPFPALNGSNNNAVDDVHLEWYGKTCNKDNELLHMSCADVDLIFLSAGTLPNHYAPGDTTIGSLDVHFVINGSNNPILRVDENSLMGNAVIVDPDGGWAAAYPAAAAKSTHCAVCGDLDGGTDVGYEPYPLEVFLPFALVDDSQGPLSNILALWAPTFFPGNDMPSTFGIQWDWYDGRERRFPGSQGRHSFVASLKSLDPIHSTNNTPETWTCGHSTSAGIAENDGFARAGIDPQNCGTTSTGDSTHPSDELDNQTSTPLSWWDFNKSSDSVGPFEFYTGFSQARRGLVGVNITEVDSVPVPHLGVADTTRLWHKDPCEVAPRGTVGPPHLRDFAFENNGSYLVGFNLFTKSDQLRLCRREAPDFTPPDPFPGFDD